MQALRIHKTDAGIEPRLQEMAVDELSEGNVLIRVHYSSVNYKDALAVTGKGQILRRFPLNGGIDASGVVESSDDNRFAPGDAVIVTGCELSEQRDGGYAEYLRMPADSVVPCPEGLTLYEAMGLGTAGFTAGLALHRMLQNNQRPELGPVAVTGATGGVGSIAIQVLASAGFEPVAVTRKAETAGDYLRKLGATDVITPDDIPDDGKPLSRAGWGGVVDNVGGDLLARLITQVAPFGNVGAIGLAASPKLETTVLPFILRGVNLLGVHSVECPMDQRQAVWEALAGARKPPHLDSVISQTVALRDLEQVCSSVIAGETTGRAVVDLHA